MADFGTGLGQFIGGALGAQDLQRGSDLVNSTAGGFGATVAPYNDFGQSFLPGAASGINNLTAKAGQTMSYEDFAKSYQTSPGVKYQLDVAENAQNNSASAKGGLLSGTNARALSTISQGIASTGLNTAYDQYLKGSNTQFAQLESALGDMFKAIGVGTTVTGQDAAVTTGQMNNQAAIAQAQAKNDSSKGSGLGSMFGGLGGKLFGF